MKMIKPGNRLYWFMYDTFVRAWNDFKDLIGHPSDDPKWREWIDARFPNYFPEWIDED